MSANYQFRKIDGLTKFLEVLLGLGVVMAVVSLLSSFMQAELLNRDSYSAAEAQANDSREQIIGLLHMALYLFTAIIFGCWIVRANKNVRALGADGLRITPGWSVGYFFVPILNLWRPYQAMEDLWRASHNPAAWTRVTASFVLPVWWALWILSNFLNQVSFRATMNAEGRAALQMATRVGIASQAVDIPLCLFALMLVAQIAKAQQNHAHSST